jgi:FkbM family methyltransferase
MNLFHAVARAIPPLRRLHDSRNQLAAQLAAAQAELGHAVSVASPFSFYNSRIEAEAIMRRHAVQSEPRPGYLVNFLGVAIDPKFFPAILDGRAGQVEPVPIPANWHADVAEWAAALRAVELAKKNRSKTFTVIELGCGWGCWMNNTGVAARRQGLKVKLIGIEGDPGHIAFAREACAANGFKPEEVELHHGVAGARPGVALFPRQDRAGETWGLEPLFNPSDEALAAARASGDFDELPVIGLDALAKGRERIDLLHVDIQGGEAELIEQSLAFLNRTVAFVLVGTHSREIEGRLFQALGAAGWMLEIERPAILALTDQGPKVTVDGVQGWRNPALSPA